MHAKLLQSCLTLCNPMDCGPPGSSVHGILQARILEWDSHALLQGIFLTQGSNPCLLWLLHWRQILYHSREAGRQTSMLQIRVGYVDSEGAARGAGRTNWDSSTNMWIVLCVKSVAMGSCCIAQGAQLSALWCPRGVGRGGRGRRETLEGGDICTHIADSLCCTAETNTTS